MKRGRKEVVTREILIDAQARGLSQKVLSAELGVSNVAICRACSRHEVKLPHGLARPAPRDREHRMKAMYERGYTLEQIGAQFAITRERVRQLLTKHYGMSAKDGGAKLVAEMRREQRQRRLDVKSYERWGCSFTDYLAIRDFGGKGQRSKRPTLAFASQRQNARKRGIEWEMTLAEWWSVWQASGKWDERGRGQGYVMCRKADQGPYAIWNVFIATARENTSEANRKDKSLPMGVHKSKATGYLALRQIKGKKLHLGTFSTPELAHAAYLAAAPIEGARP